MSSTSKTGARKVLVAAVIEPLTQEDFDNCMVVPAEVEDDRHDEHGVSLLGILEVPASHDSPERLKMLQDAVGGWIEPVYADTFGGEPMPFPLVAFVNEEGLIHNLPLNVIASRLFNRPLFGPAVVFGRVPGEEHDLRSVSLGLVKMLTNACTGLLEAALEADPADPCPVDTINKAFLMRLLEVEGA